MRHASFFFGKVKMAETQIAGVAGFIAELVQKNGADRSRLTAILHEVQEKYNYLPEQALRDIAVLMEIPLVDIYGVATFYSSFSTEPKGRHIVTVCMGTACHVRNSTGLLEEICRHLNVSPGETTADMMFTVETVNCLGACAMGPVMVVDGTYYGEMSASKVPRVLKNYRETGHREETPEVGPLESPEALEVYRVHARRVRYPDATSMSLCCGPGCLAVGAGEVADALEVELKEQGLSNEVLVRSTGCHGFCERGPLLVIRPQGLFYQKVKPSDARDIVRETVMNGQVVERLLYEDPSSGELLTNEADIPFYAKQRRSILGANDIIDPRDIDDYIATGGYRALSKALLAMEPEEIIAEVESAGLRGRGGGGFPAASKWKAARKARSSDGVKYVLCNADEGDPGAFMDRCLLEGNPHSVLEGMVIGARAIGANNGYVYVRNEYPLAVESVTDAIEQAEEKGLLGKNILGSGFDFDDKGKQGRRRFRLRRVNGADGLDRGQGRRAEGEVHPHRRAGSVPEADQPEQRRDLGQRAADNQRRSGEVRGGRDRGQQGHKDILAGRKDKATPAWSKSRWG